MPQGYPGPIWLKVGQILRPRNRDGSFGIVVAVYQTSARVSYGGTIYNEGIYESQRRACKGRFAKVFHGESNIDAQVWLKSESGSWLLTPTNQRFAHAHRFWWGPCRDETYVARTRQLAAVIIDRVIGDIRLTDLFFDRFAAEWIAALPPGEFFLTEAQVREWAERASAEFASEGAAHASA